MLNSFVHLDVKSSFTHRFDSLIRINQLIQKAKQNGMKAVAITDENVLHAVVDFYILAKEENIKPIIGITINVQTEGTVVPVVLLAKNQRGYKNIVKISSLAQLRRTKDVYITLEELNKCHSDLVIMLNFNSFFATKKGVDLIPSLIQQYVTMFGREDLYLAIQAQGLAYQQDMHRQLRIFANKSGIQLVATNDVHYLEEKEAGARKILQKIQKNEGSLAHENSQHYFKSSEEMNVLFASYPEAIRSTQEIADKCNVTLGLKGEDGFVPRLPLFKVPKTYQETPVISKNLNILPNFPTSELEMQSIAYLCYLAEEGLLRIFGQNEVALKRLRYELSIIINKKYANYFLIVQDFMKYARENGVLSGPGRGSAAGALLSYCLGITRVDPLHYDLMFERFLNPERSDDPDIDIDFSQVHRHLLFTYAQKTYGVLSTAKIITFNNYGGKLAIRDVGNALKADKEVIDQLAKAVQSDVSELVDEKEFVQKMTEKEPKVSEVIRYASFIQGLPKNRSVHGAGLVLANGPLSDGMPVMVTDDAEMGKPILITQIHKDLLEVMGYTKMDFLGLRNLDIIHSVKKRVLETKQINITDIPLNDEKTFSLYQKGETIGVFQMDSKQMRQTSQKVKPAKIEDIFPLIALFRPGSMDMIPIYAKNRANNEFVIYDLNEVYDAEKKRMVKEFTPFEEDVRILKPILDVTYGVIVYQEQIIQILQVWAGYRLGEADIVRRAISKKKKTVIEEEKKVFMEKSISLGRDKETSERLYYLIVKFSGYGFNVPHSAAYGILSYETAYLKANFPLEFMSESITSLMDETKKAALYLQEAIRMGIQVLPPDINSSTVGFEVDGNSMTFGMALVKNVGTNASKAIVEERVNGPYVSLEQFRQRIRSKGVDKKCIESLINIGAFDQLGKRKEMFDQMSEKEKIIPILDGQILFSEIPNIGEDDLPKLSTSDDYSIGEKIALEEKLMSMAFTKSPAQKHQEDVVQVVQAKNDQEKGTLHWVGGSIVAKKVIKDKKQNEMAFIRLELSNGMQEMDITLFHDQWKKYKDNIQLYQLYLIQLSGGNGKYAAKHIEPLIERNSMVLEVPVQILKSEAAIKAKWMQQLARIMRNHPGTDAFILKIGKDEKKYAIDLSAPFLQALQPLQIKKENIKFEKVRYD